MAEEIKYSPKKAAMILIQKFLEGEAVHPKFMSAEDKTEALADYGWKITGKRDVDIDDQFDSIAASFKKRVDEFVAKLSAEE